jgi:nucleoside-diphosphate-sugar epimerase
MDEKHPKQPQSPYSASKIGADMIAMSYFNSFDLPLTVVRPFNTYGPRQSSRAIIPTIISQVANGIQEIKLGDLRPTRDFNYVKDTCEGFLAIAQSEKTVGLEVNIATGQEISMGDLVSLIGELMGSDISVHQDEARIRPAKSEVFRLLGDNKLIKSLTGFEPTYSIRDGLSATIEWIRLKENLATYKHGIYNV